MRLVLPMPRAFQFHLLQAPKQGATLLDTPHPAVIPVPKVSPEERDRLREEARRSHYQDQPYSTAALTGGVAGAILPALMSTLYHGPSKTWDEFKAHPGQMGAATALSSGVGMLAGPLAEAASRGFARLAGPSFDKRKWHRDQDPHRWNGALRLLPLLATSAAARIAAKELFSNGVTKAGSDLSAAVRRAESDVAVPSLKQIESGNYRKGHVTLHGLDITIETASGQTRKGVSAAGKAWSVTLQDPYGYIKGTDSAEPGDQMDVFIGPHPENELVFVVDQNKPGTQAFDEHKCVMGVRNSAEAKALYLRNYSEGWTGFRDVTPLTILDFKYWLKYGDMTKPYADQAQQLRKRRVPDMAAYKAAMLQSEQCEVRRLWRTGDNSVPPLAEFLPNFFAGHGAKTAGSQHRKEGQRQGLLEAQLLLAAKRAASQESPLYAPCDLPGSHAAAFGLGKGVKFSTWDAVRASGSELERRESFYHPAACVGGGTSNSMANDSRWATDKSGSNGTGGRLAEQNFASALRDRDDSGRRHSGKSSTFHFGPTGVPRLPYVDARSSTEIRAALQHFKSSAWTLRLGSGKSFDDTASQSWLKNGDVTQPLAGQQFNDFHKQAFDFNALAQGIKEQMPGFHVPESLVGAVAGGLAGAAYHGASNLWEDPRQHARKSLLRRALIGAGIGGAGANLVGDRLRRYLSNMPNPATYDVHSKLQEMGNAGWKGFVTGAIKDKPIPLTAENSHITPMRMIRRETLRRGFGVHTDDPVTDYLKVIGQSQRGADILNLSDRFFDKNQQIKPEFRDVWQQLAPRDFNSIMTAEPGKFVHANGPFLGNFSARNFGDTAQFLDRWDFDLHPDERGDLKQNMLDWWRGAAKPQPLHNMGMQFNIGKTRADATKSLLARHSVDQTVARNMPYFFQSFRIPTPEEGKAYDAWDSQELPYRIPLFNDK